MAFSPKIAPPERFCLRHGSRVGIVDKVEGGRIKLTRAEAPGGSHEGHHHYVPGILVAAIEGDKVRLSADAANAELFEEEEDGKTRH